jgi:hypothetical protein
MQASYNGSNPVVACCFKRKIELDFSYSKRSYEVITMEIQHLLLHIFEEWIRPIIFNQINERIH